MTEQEDGDDVKPSPNNGGGAVQPTDDTVPLDEGSEHDVDVSDGRSPY